jgi:hypothetical protein
MFQAVPIDEPRIRRLRLVADPDTIGRTRPNPEGHTYRHGVLTGYSLGRRRCDYYRGACAQYRGDRRAGGKDDPRQPRPLASKEGAGFGLFDAVLAAAARAAGAEALESADTGFSAIAAIHHVVPDPDGIRELLTAPEE